MGIDPSVNTCTRWGAYGIIAVGMLKSHRGLRKATHARRERLRVSPINGAKVIEVIADDEDYVGTCWIAAGCMYLP
ncbi:MAG: Uncharacterised protein [Opitutia bacterium UBA7350]|nr:MAG: Uncharacterised protein [Opitutae bacterium UBA7350]